MLDLLPPSQTERAGGRRQSSADVRVVMTGAEGVLRALNHVNKTAKGALVRVLAEQRPSFRSRRGLLRWAESAGVQTVGRVRRRGPAACMTGRRGWPTLLPCPGRMVALQ